MNLLEEAKSAYRDNNYRKSLKLAHQCFHSPLTDNYNKALALEVAGIVMMHQDKFIDADNLFKQAQITDPTFTKARYHRGVICMMTKRYPQAIMFFHGLHQEDPNNIKIWIAYVTALAETGDLAEAWKEMQLLWKANSKLVSVMSAYARYVSYATPIEEWKDYWPGFKRDKELTDTLQLSNLTYRSAWAWAVQDIKLLDKYLRRLKNILSILDGKDLKVPNAAVREQLRITVYNAQAYFNFMSLLAKKEPILENKDLPKIYMIGDSHSLIPVGQEISINNKNFQVKSQLVMGVKAWHLARRKNSLHKASMQQAIARLPGDATVIISVGEIDSRDDEGVWNVLRKKNLDMQETLDKTFPPAIDWIAKCSGGRKIIICGIPVAPISRIERKLGENLETYLVFLEKLNESWVSAAKTKGFDVIDFYSMTTDKDGKPTAKWHLDDIHLQPEALDFAVKNHYIPCE